MFVKANAILFTCKYDNFSRSHDAVIRVYEAEGNVTVIYLKNELHC
jgi:hypothetical protein